MRKIKARITSGVLHLFVILVLSTLSTHADGATRSFTATEYATIYSDAPDVNDTSTNSIWLWLYSPTSGTAFGLLKFNVNGIPDGSTITDVDLELYCPRDDGIEVSINNCKTSWSKSSICWNNRPSFGTLNLFSNSSGVGKWYWHSSNLTDIVQDWVDNSSTNKGLYLLPNTRGGDVAIFSSSHSSVSSNNRPKLIVEYTEPCTYSISPTSKSFSPEGGSGSFSVSTGSGCHWSISQRTSWISVSNGSGNGSGTVSYSIPSNISNEGTTSRTGTITVEGNTYTITQEGLSITRITISGPSQVDQSSGAQYSCTAYYSDGRSHTITNTASWSENSSYAEINSTGYLTAHSVTRDQICTITASYGGKTDTHSVKIKYIPPVLTGITISGPTQVNQESGAQYICTAHYDDGSSSTVTRQASWSENSANASISSNGYLKATSVSADKSCTITATYGGKTDTHNVKIKYIPPVLTGITISGSSQVAESSGAQYICTAHYDDGSSSTVTRQASWKVSSTYASINSNGYLKATSVPADKSCTITATYGGKTDTHNVTIKNQVNSVVLTSINISGSTKVDEGSMAQYSCTAHYSDGSTSNVTSQATWSENSIYASIGKNGYLSASSVSSDQPCRLTSTYHGKTDTLDITIKNLENPKVATPIFSPDGGTFTDSVQIKLSCATSGAKIRYTIDGSAPTSSSTLYGGVFKINSSCTIKACGFKDNYTSSDIVSAHFTINTGNDKPDNDDGGDDSSCFILSTMN